jgi:hypothetical protein
MSLRGFQRKGPKLRSVAIRKNLLQHCLRFASNMTRAAWACHIVQYCQNDQGREVEKRRQEANGANWGGNKYGSARALKPSKTETFLECIEDEESLTGEKKKHNVSFADSQRTSKNFVRFCSASLDVFLGTWHCQLLCLCLRLHCKSEPSLRSVPRWATAPKSASTPWCPKGQIR